MVKDSSSYEVDKDAIQGLIRKNVLVLCKLYDQGKGAFNYKVYVNDLPGRLLRDLPIPYVAYLVGTALPRSIDSRHSDVRIDDIKDLKYNGHACVGLSKYILATQSKDSRLLNMQHSSLDYLLSHQSDSGALVCRFIRGDGMKYGADRQSIAESSEALLWALAASLEIYRDDEKYLKILTESARKVGTWLATNIDHLFPQEIGRVIYGLSELHVATGEKRIVRWITHLSEILIRKLGNLRSFGLFSEDIDAIGGLSLASSITGKSVFVEVASLLVSNQLINQGQKGEWRLVLNQKTGSYKRFYDVTYTVHQLGMGPWAFSRYLLASNHNITKQIMKGILWVITKKASTDEFVIRSFSGLTGNVYELEQRSYEPGLNILGLLSYGSIRGLRTKLSC